MCSENGRGCPSAPQMRTAYGRGAWRGLARGGIWELGVRAALGCLAAWAVPFPPVVPMGIRPKSLNPLAGMSERSTYLGR